MAVLAFVSLFAVAGSARADGCKELAVGKTVSLGFLLPEPDCPITVHGDVGFDLGETYHERRPLRLEEGVVDARLFAELGLLFAVDGTHEDVHLGPVFSVAGMNDAAHGEFDRTEVAGLILARFWAADFMNFDFKAGPALSWESDLEMSPGAYASIGFGFHGFAGGHMSYDYVAETGEHRIMGGIQMTHAAFVFLLCAASN